MCNKTVRDKPYLFEDVLNHYKTQEMCNKTVHEDPCFLQYVPDWFVTQEMCKNMEEDDNYHNDDGLAEWCNGYEQRKTQRTPIKE